jgi:biopolymer transport protein TolQ
MKLFSRFLSGSTCAGMGSKMLLVNLIAIFACVSNVNAQVEQDLLSELEPPSVDLAAVASQHSILDLVMGSGAVVQGVLILLVLMSVLTWGIVITKFFRVMQAKKQSLKFEDIFWSSKNLAQINEVSSRLDCSPVAKVYRAGHRELTAIINSSEKAGRDNDFGNIESIDRALKKAKAEQLNDLEKGTTFLATTASAAPFIGLFGTVWGIMNAFIGLSQTKSSSIQAVAPGISEALIATAIGLAAAIPAAIFYNVFMQQTRVLARGIDMFSAEFLNIARRHFLK